MNVDGKHYRTNWIKEDVARVGQIIDQRHLPHQFLVEDLVTVDDVTQAVKDNARTGNRADRSDRRLRDVMYIAALPAAHLCGGIYGRADG